jgi:enoyl-CoA hydratase/carnithine racemase
MQEVCRESCSCHHREGAVLVLSNNNQAARNALSQYFHAVMEALRAAGTDASVAAVILTGRAVISALAAI